MKKTTFVALTALSFVVAPAFADIENRTFSEQLQLQKTQLRPQAFNFFSDRYIQVQAMKKPVTLSFKEQLDSQKSLLRKQQFNPISDAYLQTHARQS
ncbi:hypothetical protein [Methylophaga sulfidovorans]|jgi:hypothetical protein|uniref:Peptidylprolyl isomerase n=1 Tax=Methylophaga sulfidovorans TaxID=45496 RepID=A0A1I3ZML4_9GAMM|nr:hypothetical protein [Methylophaga sulfidovorans]SFK45190.1 hypothetical protein SAMN04488079_11177 [Methylophaga sulfidovorans]